jgi:hypothetical protein
MRKIQIALPVLLGLGFLVCTGVSYGKPEYAKKESKTCMFCHGKVEAKENMPKNLTAAGKYYQSHNHSLEGYTEKK